MLTVIEPLTTHQDLMGSPERGQHIPRLGTDRESRRMRARPRPGGHMDGHPEDLRGSS